MSNTELVNRLENFLVVEIESRDMSESPLERIKHEYFELLYRLKNKLSSKDKITQVLNPVVEYSISVLRTILKSIKSFDDRKTQESMMKMASMDRHMHVEKVSINSRAVSPRKRGGAQPDLGLEQPHHQSVSELQVSECRGRQLRLEWQSRSPAEVAAGDPGTGSTGAKKKSASC